MESRELTRECASVVDGNSQFETREKDFFFRRGGWLACLGWMRTSGRGGGSGWPRARRGLFGGGAGTVGEEDIDVCKRDGVGLDGAV
jgi:hypothetical protein